MVHIQHNTTIEQKITYSYIEHDTKLTTYTRNAIIYRI